VTRISKIGNAVLRAQLYMPALSAMRYNPAIVALVARLKSRGRLKPKQIVVAAMRKLLVLCFGVLKTGKPFDPGDSDGLLSHIEASIAWRALVGGRDGGQAPQPEGARASARA
jgi:Transposase IS116/IS110/IS902 family.